VVPTGYSREKSGDPEEKMKRILIVLGELLDPEAVVASLGVDILQSRPQSGSRSR